MPKGQGRKPKPKDPNLLLQILSAWTVDWAKNGCRYSALNVDTENVKGLGLVLGNVFACQKCDGWFLRSEHEGLICNACKDKLPEKGESPT